MVGRQVGKQSPFHTCSGQRWRGVGALNRVFKGRRRGASREARKEYFRLKLELG